MYTIRLSPACKTVRGPFLRQALQEPFPPPSAPHVPHLSPPPSCHPPSTRLETQHLEPELFHFVTRPPASILAPSPLLHRAARMPFPSTDLIILPPFKIAFQLRRKVPSLQPGTQGLRPTFYLIRPRISHLLCYCAFLKTFYVLSCCRAFVHTFPSLASLLPKTSSRSSSMSSVPVNTLSTDQKSPLPSSFKPQWLLDCLHVI